LASYTDLTYPSSRAPPAKLGEGKAFLPSPSLAGEGGRSDAASQKTVHTINTTVIRDFAANPDPGYLRSGKVHGALD